MGLRRRRGRGAPLWILYLSMLLFLAEDVYGCLSNPRLPCSVASSQSFCQPPAAAAGTTSYQRDVYARGQYQGFLGSSVEARAYSEAASLNQFAATDEELQCINVTSCSWKNAKDDQLDWVTGSGEVSELKLNVITGSSILPGNSFLMLASGTRPSAFGGSLISKAIACQPSSGLLSFRYWRSRARGIGQEPDLDVCTRRVPDNTLENCLTIEPTPNHTVLASIPPMLTPFEIVLRGYGFDNEPEGGLIIIDYIDYFAHLETSENCAAAEAITIPPEAIVEPETTTEGIELLSTMSTTPTLFLVERDVPEPSDSFNKSKDILLMSSEDGERDSCKSLECNLEETSSAGCLYRRVGTGAKGEGYRVGWKVAHTAASPSNPLTGIHAPPNQVIDPFFLVAEFPGYQSNRREHRYILESPEYLLDEKAEAYLSFKKYMATQGIELMCFWDAFQNSADPFTRKWTKEVVKLPTNINKFFIICTQDPTERANVGQVGLSSIGLFSDAEATVPFC